MLQPRRQTLGQLAVIGTDGHEENIYSFKGKYALHTMVALDDNRYLQVTALSGNMGITSGLEETLAYYRQATPDAAVYTFDNPPGHLPIDMRSREFVRRFILP